MFVGNGGLAKNVPLQWKILHKTMLFNHTGIAQRETNHELNQSSHSDG